MAMKLIATLIGELSEDWNTSSRECKISFYDDHILISTKVLYKEYKLDDLEKLKFNYTSEIKKTLFLSKKIEYVSIIIGETEIPKIATSHVKIDEVKNKIANHKKYIREKIKIEQLNEQLKRDEKLLILESFKKDITTNYSGLNYYISDFRYTASFFEMHSSEKNYFSLFTIGLYTSIERHMKKSMTFDINKYLNPIFIRNFINYKINVQLFKPYENSYGGKAVLNKINIYNEVYTFYLTRNFLDLTDGVINDLFDDISGTEESTYLSLLYSYHLALALNIIIRLNRNVTKIIQGDIKTIIDNLIASDIVDNNYILEKVYPIYTEYKEDNLQTLEKIEFRIVLNIYLHDNYYGIHCFYKIYEEFLDNLHKNVQENDLNLNLIEIIKNMLINMNVDLFFDNVIVTNTKTKDVYEVFINYLMYFLYKIIPIKYIETVFDNNFKNMLIDILYEKNQKEYIKLERDRLLRGDFKTEVDYYNDTLSFDSITNGYDFEEYLKTIFDKHGYYVEVTKRSGDQGADLVLNKNNEKIVVQAKFYSRPVGNKAVQEVVSAIAFYNANKGMVVTNNRYTQSAIELANANNIKLIDGAELQKMRESIQI
ncbi:restriction endonuclease [Acetoanaerobium noterae]|uniref:restriction endonuclease n=1 Tax=Acetoanaerobium noterae TaxID=745369 RepID=UPI0028AFA0D9|nr:restriction endonuclease [Acetoanaerobium noterae]